MGEAMVTAAAAASNKAVMAPDPIVQADALAAKGEGDHAAALLSRAADAGNADAGLHLAMWRLLGTPVPRDVAAARSLLGRAAQQGNADALLIATALMANGSGGSVDWAGALHLLRRQAHLTQDATAQIDLLDRLKLTADGYPAEPIEAERIGTAPDIWRVRGFLSPAECAHVVNAAIDLMEPANVIDPRTGRIIPHVVRTSSSAAIGPTRETLVIGAINRRLAMLSGTKVEQGEPLAVLHYAHGQQYRPHLDTLPHTANQRTHTVLLYLNEGYAGGETLFVKSGLTVSGKLGDAVLFRNVLADGSPDTSSQHAGLPVAAGFKWLATRWIRQHAHDVWAAPT
jgi:prolyl 4-hydroxylase